MEIHEYQIINFDFFRDHTILAILAILNLIILTILFFVVMKKINFILRILGGSIDYIDKLVRDVSVSTQSLQDTALKIQNTSHKTQQAVKDLESIIKSTDSMVKENQATQLQEIASLNVAEKEDFYNFDILNGTTSFHYSVNPIDSRKVELALRTATIRQLRRLKILDVQNIVYGIAKGSYSIFTPQGETVTIPFSENGQNAYEGTIVAEIKGEIKRFTVYYHATCFNLIRSLEGIEGVDLKKFQFIPFDKTQKVREKDNLYDKEIDELMSEAQNEIKEYINNLSERYIRYNELFVYIADEGQLVIIREGNKEALVYKDDVKRNASIKLVDVFDDIEYKNTKVTVGNDYRVLIEWDKKIRYEFDPKQLVDNFDRRRTK